MIPDNYSQWERREWEAERWLASRPICCVCGEHIQEEPKRHPETDEEMCTECFKEYEEEHDEEK